MKKTIAIVAGAALLAGVSMGVANAQSKATGPFADVPTDHWAYSSVEKLRSAGIVIGYPDGTYGGTKPISRYEFATAVARILKLLPDGEIVTKDQLSNYVTKDQMPDLTPFAKSSDVDALKADILARLEKHSDAIQALKDAVANLQPELQQLGVDVASANNRLDALSRRVDAVQEEMDRVKITGEFNVIVRSDINTSATGSDPMDQNGYHIGTVGNTSIFDKPVVYNDFLLGIVGKVDDNTKAVFAIDAGNYLSWLGSPTADMPGTDHHISGSSPATSFSLYKAYLETSTSIDGHAATTTVGRFGEQFSALTFKAVDPDRYTKLPETDSGDAIIDGAKIQIGEGAIKASAFAGKVATDYPLSANGYYGASNSVVYRPGTLNYGGSTYVVNPIDNVGGVHVTADSIRNWKVGLTGVFGRTTNTLGDVTDPAYGGVVNTFAIFGADLKGDLPYGITFKGEYALDGTGVDSHFSSVNSTTNNSAWNAGLAYDWNSLKLKVAYEDIEAYYAAPGFWQQIGDWTNPTNIRGVKGEIDYSVSPKIGLKAYGGGYQGVKNVDSYSPLKSDDKVAQAVGEITLKATEKTTFDLGYEWVGWDLSRDTAVVNSTTYSRNAGKPIETYATIGITHIMSANSSIRLLYQALQYQDKGTNFDDGQGDTHGGLFVTQATFKF
jgi:hypothetical protein